MSKLTATLGGIARQFTVTVKNAVYSVMSAVFAILLLAGLMGVAFGSAFLLMAIGGFLFAMVGLAIQAVFGVALPAFIFIPGAFAGIVVWWWAVNVVFPPGGRRHLT